MVISHTSASPRLCTTIRLVVAQNSSLPHAASSSSSTCGCMMMDVKTAFEQDHECTTPWTTGSNVRVGGSGSGSGTNTIAPPRSMRRGPYDAARGNRSIYVQRLSPAGPGTRKKA
jgi:hypothetical protein